MKSRLSRAQKLKILEFNEPKESQENNKELDSEPNITHSPESEESEQENSEISDSEEILVSGSSKLEDF